MAGHGVCARLDIDSDPLSFSFNLFPHMKLFGGNVFAYLHCPMYMYIFEKVVDFIEIFGKGASMVKEQLTCV